MFLTGVATSPQPSTDASKGSTALLDYCSVLTGGWDRYMWILVGMQYTMLSLYIKKLPSPEVQSKIMADVRKVHFINGMSAVFSEPKSIHKSMLKKYTI